MTILYFFHGYALFISNVVDTDIHQHHLVEIFISLDNSLKIKSNKQHYKAKNIIIDSDELHQLDNNDNFYILLLLDSESIITRQLQKIYLNDNGINILQDSLFISFQNDLKKLINTDCKIEEAKATYNKIIHHLLGKKIVEINKFDPRIEKVLSILYQLPEKKMKIKELAYMVCMSESRLIHLFTEQIGIPIRRYLLWLRLLDAINLIIQGIGFTTAAHETGFSDSAHLSRTFKKMFGLKLLALFKNYKNSQFVQVKTEKI
jgi:AraC-like DNA-binding protein